MSTHPALPGWSRPAAVVVGWVLFNVLLAAVLALAFHGELAEHGQYGVAMVLVLIFGAVVALAAARGRTGQQTRQPVRSTSALWWATACLLAGLGAVFHWWIAVAGCYPLLAAFTVRGRERLPAKVAPEPATTRLDAAPRRAGGPPTPYTGPPGASEPVPRDHPGHGPPRGRPRPSSPLHWVVLALGVVWSVLRRRPRR